MTHRPRRPAINGGSRLASLVRDFGHFTPRGLEFRVTLAFARRRDRDGNEVWR
jgi:hypothetical protein